MRSNRRPCYGLIIAFAVCTASVSEAQTVQSVSDYSQASATQGGLPATGRTELRVFLDKTFRVDPGLAAKVPLAWTGPARSVDESLLQTKSLAAALASSGKEVDAVEVLLRDLRPEDYQDAFATIKGEFTRSRGAPFFLVLKTEAAPRGTLATDAREIRDEQELAKRWMEVITSKKAIRYAILKQVLAVTLSPPDAERRRQDIVNQYIQIANAPAKKLLLGDIDAANLFVTSTNNAFEAWIGGNLLNDRVRAYELSWSYQLRRGLLLQVKDPTWIASTQTFYTSLQRQALSDKRTVTVTVSASRGDGALVKYAKTADAANDLFTDMGFTVVTRELERARYVFRTYRVGRQTGQATWDCTRQEYCPVSVLESP